MLQIINGKELKIDISWDDDHGFLLFCSIQLNKGKGLGGLHEDEIRNMMYNEFEKYGVFSHKSKKTPN